MTVDASSRVPFQAHVDLLQRFIEQRQSIVARLEPVLNAQRRPAQQLRDRPLLTRQLADCFYAPGTVSDEQRRLYGQLLAAHRSSGFMPCQVPGLHNDIIDPAELLMRAFHFWSQTRWPGRNGRVRFAETLFNLYLLRELVLLAMRSWDAGAEQSSARLAQVQALLDAVWHGAPDDQPVFVRDARWLIPLAQSPTTEDLVAYLELAERIAGTPEADDRLEIQQTHVRMVGGHLCAQIRHYCLEDRVGIDDASVVRRTRTSNALDFALLVQGLVPMLAAYEQAKQAGDETSSFRLAAAILQGISPDPELFLNRVDLLGPYSMIEQFCATPDRAGTPVLTPVGQRHHGLLEDYAALIGRMAGALFEDSAKCRPADGACSPYGVIFGTPTNLIEDMALKSLERDAETRFTLEDVFVDGDPGPERLAWVSGWRQLPHVDKEVQQRYAYPHDFAVSIFERIEQALRRHADRGSSGRAPRTGRLLVLPGAAPGSDTVSKAVPKGVLDLVPDALPDAAAGPFPELPANFIRSSDAGLVAEGRAVYCEQAELLHDRQEGHFVVSYETPGGWAAVSKDFLTEILGAGQDARLSGLPAQAAAVLGLMCPGLLVPAARQEAGGASAPPG